MKKNFYSSFLKHTFDFFFALLLIFLLFPFILFIILLQILFNGFPIFFLQKRVGKNEKIFKIIKFRSMSNNFSSNGNELDDIKRITPFGKFLRETSLDELPSLINVLKGEMSFVGPRPLLEDYLPLYSEKQKIRHKVKPGISGLAQISGRNLLSWNEKFIKDIEYVSKISLFLDLKILFLTFLKILTLNNNDINSTVDSTMERFNGNKDN